jgi:dynactin-4
VRAQELIYGPRTAQLQKLDDTLPHHAIYEQLRDHIEPYLRKGLSQASSSGHAGVSTSSHQPTQAIAAAARALTSSNSTLGREIPSSIASASRFNSLHNLDMAANAGSSARHNLRRAGKQNQHQFIVDPETLKDDMKPFSMISTSEKGKNKAKTQSVSLADVEKQKIGVLRKSTSLDEVVSVDRRWTVSHDAPLRITELEPQRIPLKSRRTKRCNGCRHILIKVCIFDLKRHTDQADVAVSPIPKRAQSTESASWQAHTYPQL